MTTNNIPSPLEPHNSDRVLNYLGVAGYMSDPQCNMTAEMFYPNSNGWTKGLFGSILIMNWLHGYMLVVPVDSLVLHLCNLAILNF